MTGSFGGRGLVDARLRERWQQPPHVCSLAETAADDAAAARLAKLKTDRLLHYCDTESACGDRGTSRDSAGLSIRWIDDNDGLRLRLWYGCSKRLRRGVIKTLLSLTCSFALFKHGKSQHPVTL